MLPGKERVRAELYWHWMRTLGLVIAAFVAPTAAVADDNDHFQFGAFFGPRIFSSDSLLGFNDNQPYHPDLTNGMGFGARVGRPFGMFLVPELELAVVPTRTTKIMDIDTYVVWLEPRVHLRVDLLPQRVVEPFILFGGGAPISVSSARKTFNSGVIGEGYLGAGLRFDTHKGFIMRLDARV